MKVVLKYAIEIVIFVFGLFGGFLFKITPPQDEALGFTLGISQMLTLLLLLAIAVLTSRRFVADRNKTIKAWVFFAVLSLAAFIVVAFLYKRDLEKHSFRLPYGNVVIRTDQLTKDAADWCAEHKFSSAEECLQKIVQKRFTLEDITEYHRLWDEPSVLKARSKLYRGYILLVAFFCISLFSLVEIFDKYIREENRPIRTLRLFLASSSELEAERRAFEIFISRENKVLRKKHFHIEMLIWEDADDSLAKEGLQQRYNEMAAAADIFVALFWTKAGKYTQEEFTAALKNFMTSDKPVIYTYFKTSVSGETQLTEFLQELRALKHYPTLFTDTGDLKYKFKGQLETLLPRL
jgi:hypothetical protein